MFSKMSVELTSEQEDSYRQFHLRTDVKQARLGILLFAVPLASLVFNDYHFLGLSSEFYGIAALRFGLLVYTVLVFIQIGKAASYKSYDRSITVYSFVLMVCSGIINATRPTNYIVQVLFTCIAVFVVCLITPNRLVNQILISSTAVIGEVAIIMIFQQPSNIPAVFTVFLSLLLADLIAVSGSWQLQVYRRRSFQDLTKNNELQHELELHTKHLEELVEDRSEKLKNAERLAAIGATASMVGHDIRNPLTSITAAVYISKSKLKNLPDSDEKESLKKNLDLIADQTTYVNKIVTDLQDFARPLNPKMEEIDLKNMVQFVLSSLKVPDNIMVEQFIDPQFLKLKTDPVYLQRILTNLANNALQAMPDGGKLKITATPQNDKARIAFEDTGVGIPLEVRNKLFTPLVTTKPKGQGFGLAVVKRLTEALGGTVTFESETGKGTKFIVVLPK
jgi:signal transduction histidine kinase